MTKTLTEAEQALAEARETVAVAEQAVREARRAEREAERLEYEKELRKFQTNNVHFSAGDGKEWIGAFVSGQNVEFTIFRHTDPQAGVLANHDDAVKFAEGILAACARVRPMN